MNLSQRQKDLIQDKIRVCCERLGWDDVSPTIFLIQEIRGRYAGMAVYPCTIRLNVEGLEKFEDEIINQTLPHELAHLYVDHHYKRRTRPHGKEWQQAMIKMGLEPKRCHSLALTPSRKTQRFAYGCRCTTHIVGVVRHNRIRRGVRYHCRDCGETLRRTRKTNTGDMK